jgi:hypothetical protein
MFETVARPTIDDVLKGFNGTLFAFGQTGSGKTHTMFGGEGDAMGIIPRTAAYIFEEINRGNLLGQEFTVKVSFLEVYKEVIHDLLLTSARDTVPLRIREGKESEVYVEGLTAEYCADAADILTLTRRGHLNRAQAHTEMNAESSRSHSLFTIEVSQNLEDGSSRTGKLHLADLAGSERVGKSHAEGDQLREAQKINQSLSALGNCISALTDSKRTHVPFRDSKLTFLLKDSLGGNCKTGLLVCCAPETEHLEETLGTLRFAKRAKKITLTAHVNSKHSVEQYGAIMGQLQVLLAQKDQRILQLEREARGREVAVGVDAATQSEAVNEFVGGNAEEEKVNGDGGSTEVVREGLADESVRLSHGGTPKSVTGNSTSDSDGNNGSRTASNVIAGGVEGAEDADSEWARRYQKLEGEKKELEVNLETIYKVWERYVLFHNTEMPPRRTVRVLHCIPLLGIRISCMPAFPTLDHLLGRHRHSRPGTPAPRGWSRKSGLGPGAPHPPPAPPAPSPPPAQHTMSHRRAWCRRRSCGSDRTRSCWRC